MKRLYLAFTAIVAIAVVGCGGGGGGSVPPPSGSGSSGTQSDATGSATFSILVPAQSSAASSNRKSPAYVATGTGSVVFTVGTVKTVVPLTLGSSTCPLSNGYYTCTAQSNVPAGTNETIAIATYANSAGTGTPLSENSVVKTITAGTNNPLSVTLNGVANSLSMQYSETSVVAGTPTGFTAILVAKDAAGNTIVGPGALVDSSGNTITASLAVSGTDSADFTVGSEQGAGTTSISWTVSYNGSGTAGTTAMLTASATTTTPTTYTFTSGSPQTITLTTAGLAPSPSPSASVAPSPSPSASVAPSPSPSASVAPSPSPSASVAPSPSPSASVAPSPSPSPQPIYTLTGGNDSCMPSITNSCTNPPLDVTDATNSAYQIVATFASTPQSVSSNSVSLILAIGINVYELPANFPSFPIGPGTQNTINEYPFTLSATGGSVTYAQFPTVTASEMGGESCAIYQYTNGAWTQLIPLTAVSGGSVTWPATTIPGGLTISPTQQFVGEFACLFG